MYEYDYYIEKVNESDKLSDDKKEFYIQNIKKLQVLKFPVILNSYHLSNLVGIKWVVLKQLIDNKYCYHQFYVLKKNKIEKRSISAPSNELLFVQEFIKNNILAKVTIHQSAYGFVNNKSILDNAQAHLNAEMILNIDLKNFFPSIKKNRVYYIFNKICGYDKTMSYCFTKLVTLNNCLPQGAPTSPVISNIAAYKLDVRLSNLAQKLQINYTRYADDITFSGSKDKVNLQLLNFTSKIIKEEGFKLNGKKTRFSSKSCRQEVTGLIVNNCSVHVDRRYIRKVRQELHYIKKFGIDKHILNAEILNSYYLDHLKGKIMFIWQVEKEQGEKLLKQYNEIINY